ncbi:MAG: hypothetical protein KatS3mg079_825 [Caloramator sp.]|nr:MAG: hypothetical protein KatS3mg079_825 [Caloramator sp.]
MKNQKDLMKEGLKETRYGIREKEIYQKWVKLANEELPYLFLSYAKDHLCCKCKG